MSWKEGLQLRDLACDQPIEITCRVCGHGHHEWPEQLLKENDWRFLYLDELEAKFTCARKGCHGAVRLSLTSLQDTQAFVGGMA